MYTINIKTTKKDDIIDITDLVNDLILKSGERKGICNIFVAHTTCSVATVDLDPGTAQDYLNAFRELVPKLVYKHPHNPGHFGDHLLSTLLGSQVSIPFADGGMILGDWQKVAVIEFQGPEDRRVIVTLARSS